MKKQAIMALTGNIQQVACIRQVRFLEGRAGGMGAYQVRNGPLSFLIMADKCLDIGEFEYKGVNFSFLSKPGLIGRTHYDTNGMEAQRSIMGGFLFTAGTENICAPCQEGERHYPMHGRLRTTPAEYRGCDACWRKGEYVLSVRGEMREAELFGGNIVLRRSIETVYGQKKLHICDSYENCAFQASPFLLLYHFNFGWPFLSEKTYVTLPTKRVVPRDAASSSHLQAWHIMESPHPNAAETVFIHDLVANQSGKTCVAIMSDEWKLGLLIEFDHHWLPYFMQWKSVASGDYVLGLEPSNTSVYGRAYQKNHGGLPMLRPHEERKIEFTITVLDGMEEIEAAKLKIDRLLQEGSIQHDTF